MTEKEEAHLVFAVLEKISAMINVHNPLHYVWCFDQVSKIYRRIVPLYHRHVLKTAAKYCKTDLTTGIVREFPDEMQGIMAGIHIRQNGLNQDDGFDFELTDGEQKAVRELWQKFSEEHPVFPESS